MNYYKFATAVFDCAIRAQNLRDAEKYISDIPDAFGLRECTQEEADEIWNYNRKLRDASCGLGICGNELRR